MTDFYLTNKHLERINELEADNKHFEVQNKVLQARLEAAFKERDEALFDLDFSRDLYKLKDVQLDELRMQLAVARKQNSEQLTILQENGLAEYGN